MPEVLTPFCPPCSTACPQAAVPMTAKTGLFLGWRRLLAPLWREHEQSRRVASGTQLRQNDTQTLSIACNFGLAICTRKFGL